MSESAEITTAAGPTRSACGTGIVQATRSATGSICRVARNSTTASPESGCTNGSVTRSPSIRRAAASTTVGGPTSSTTHSGAIATEIPPTGAPRAATRRRAMSVIRDVVTS